MGKAVKARIPMVGDKKPSHAHPFDDVPRTRPHEAVRVVHLPYDPSALESAVQAKLARAGGRVVSLARDGASYVLVIETTYTGVI